MSQFTLPAPAPEQKPPRKRGRPALPARRSMGIPAKDAVEFEEQMIGYRLVKECERLEREGRVVNRTWLEQQLGMSRQGLSLLRAGKRTYKGVHIRNLKLRLNGDVQFVLFGVEDADHSLPYKIKNGQKVRIDVYDPYVFEYVDKAAWRIGPRREGDDEKRFEAAYYQGKDEQLTSEEVQ